MWANFYVYSHRDEAAFGELVKRHGPQVLKVCRRGLPSEHDVEDVFQATFFVLAHKAAAVSWNESVESWLCAWPAGWSCVHVPVHSNGKAGNDRSLPWEEPGLRNTAAFCPIRIIPSTIPTRKWSRKDIRRVLHAALGQLRRGALPSAFHCSGGRLARCGLLIALCAVVRHSSSPESGSSAREVSLRPFPCVRPCSRSAFPRGQQ